MANGDLEVTAVIVNWRTPDATIRLVETLSGGFERGLRFVLVENGSGDDSAGRLAEFADRFGPRGATSIVVSETNTGFTGGVNLGTDVALAAPRPPAYIWLLNPDTHATVETVEELVRVAELTGADIVSATGARAGHGFHGDAGWPKQFFARPRDFQVHLRDREWWPIDRYNGACSLFRADFLQHLIAETGYFQDESLFMDWDELEVSLRAREYGGRIVMARDAQMEHGGPRTLGSGGVAAARQYYISRNAIVVSRRYMPGWQFWLALPVHLARDFAWFARLRLSGINANERAYLAGAVDAFRGKSGIWQHHPGAPGAQKRRWSKRPEGRQARTTAVVLTWNTADLAIQTVASLAGAFEDGLRIVLVDNGSVDDSVRQIRDFLSESGFEHSVTLIESQENLGFSGGVNLGTAAALKAEPGPDFIWTLNPDAVVAPDTFKELVEIAHESGSPIVGTAGPLGFHRPPDAWPRIFYRIGPALRRNPVHRHWWAAGLYSGSCALFDADLVELLLSTDGHFLDESLFMDWDEWDCTRRAARFGARVVLARDAFEDHDNSPRTFGRTPMAASRQYYQSRNSVVVGRRYMPAWKFWFALPIHITRDLSWFLRLRFRGVQPNEKAYLLGVIDALRGRMGRWSRHPESPTASR